MGGIGIVGTGISGLQLALFLQQAGVDAVLYAERTPEEIRGSRLPNTVVRMGPTRARERSVGVNFWDFLDDDWGTGQVNFWIGAEQPLAFSGSWSQKVSMVDFRLYSGELIEAFASRGGKIVFGPMSVEELNRRSHDHDLIVVATGAKNLTGLFPRMPELSPYDAPQRAILGGFYHGVGQADPISFSYNITPGVGEVFHGAFWSGAGKVSVVAFLAVPGGPMAASAAAADHEGDPGGFHRLQLDLLAQYAPPVRERVDEKEFALTGPLDLIQGGITPTVRKGYVPLESGRFAMAVGDSWVHNDPIVGQGANMGSHCAKVMADRITAASSFDEAFCAGCEAAMWEYGRSVTEWSNSWLAPLPPYAIGVMIAAAQHRGLADDLVDGFTDPVEQWSRFGSLEGAEAFVAAHGMPLPQLPPM